MIKLFKQYYPIRNIFFVFGEGFAIFTSILLGCWIFFKIESFVFVQWLGVKIMFFTFICQVCLYYNDLYDLKVTDSFIELGIRLLQALGATCIFFACISIIFPLITIGNHIFIKSIIIVILFIVSLRFFYMIILNKGIFNEKIIVLGSNSLAQDILKEIKTKKDCGFTVSAVYDDSEHNGFRDGIDTQNMIFKKGYDNLCRIAKEMDIKKIVVTIEKRRGRLPIKELLNCRVNGIEIIEGTSFYEMLIGKLIIEQTNPAGLIYSEGFYNSYVRRFLKRGIDIILSITMLILLSPVIILTAVLIKIDSKGPIIYRQQRVKKNKKIFLLYKFRSMIVDAEKQSGPICARVDDERITHVGKYIRRFRVDELPQLWNVLKGDMSFVGPRPEREFFVKKFDDVIPYYSERFHVKQGITGWAQVSYGYCSSVEDVLEKHNYDLFYIKNMSFFFDLMIIIRTVKTVLSRKGAR